MCRTLNSVRICLSQKENSDSIDSWNSIFRLDRSGSFFFQTPILKLSFLSHYQFLSSLKQNLFLNPQFNSLQVLGLSQHLLEPPHPKHPNPKLLFPALRNNSALWSQLGFPREPNTSGKTGISGASNTLKEELHFNCPCGSLPSLGIL